MTFDSYVFSVGAGSLRLVFMWKEIFLRKINNSTITDIKLILKPLRIPRLVYNFRTAFLAGTFRLSAAGVRIITCY